MSVGTRETSGKVFQIPSSQITLLAAVFLVLLAVVVWAMWLSKPSQLSEAYKLLSLCAAFVPSFLYIWCLRATSLRIDETGITLSDCGRAKVLSWEHVVDVSSSEHLIVVSDGLGKRMRIFHSEFLGLEPFEALRQEILRRWMPQVRVLAEKEGGNLRIRYPPLSRTTWIGYLMPVGWYGLLLIGRFGVEGSLPFQILVVVMAVIVSLPFLVRDLLRTRNTLFISREGIGCRRRGTGVTIKWEEIRDIVVKEPLTVGYGKILVIGRDGKRKITIPRSIGRCGQVLYLLESRTGITPSEGFDY